MTTANEQQLSHADRHDLDKLTRWKTGLDAAGKDGGESSPACAIFLVGPEERESHDIFRRYRSAFEELGCGFHHLVIFGQHGVSTTQVAFLAEVEMTQDSVPLLILAPMDAEKGSAVWCLELPKGERDGDLDEAQNWGEALQRVRAASAGEELDFAGVPGVREGQLRHASLPSAVDGVLEELGG